MAPRINWRLARRIADYAYLFFFCMIMLPLLCILSGFILSWIAVGFLSLIVPRLGDNFAGIFIIYVTFGCGVIGLIQGWQFWRAQLKLQAQSDETPH